MEGLYRAKMLHWICGGKLENISENFEKLNEWKTNKTWKIERLFEREVLSNIIDRNTEATEMVFRNAPITFPLRKSKQRKRDFKSFFFNEWNVKRRKNNDAVQQKGHKHKTLFNIISFCTAQQHRMEFDEKSYGGRMSPGRMDFHINSTFTCTLELKIHIRSRYVVFFLVQAANARINNLCSVSHCDGKVECPCWLKCLHRHLLVAFTCHNSMSSTAKLLWMDSGSTDTHTPVCQWWESSLNCWNEILWFQ